MIRNPLMTTVRVRLVEMLMTRPLVDCSLVEAAPAPCRVMAWVITRVLVV